MEHLEVHTGDKPFLCEQCDQTISTPDTGMKVQVIVDTGAKLVQCDMCGKKFTRASNLTGHIVVHKTEKPYQCDRCRQYFESPATLKTHMDIHLNENRFECETCNKTFSSHGNLVKHKRLHETNKPFPCEICKKSYVSEAYLKSHMWEHVSEKPFECDICKKKFPLLLHLKRHLVIHSDIKPHDCDICGKSFQSPGNLKRHKQRHILYECQVCGKRYTKLDQLKEHLTDHIQDKPFSCEICDKRFLTETLLRAHKWVHTREKMPYFCAICKMKFAYSKQLKDHKVEVHGEKPKPKPKKNKVNQKTNDQLPVFEVTEDPVEEDEYSVPMLDDEPEEITYVYDPNQRYPCDICGKTFKTLRIKSQHARLHDGAKPHQCDICGNSFRTRTNLRRHAKLHNRDHPFQCTVCDKSYKTIGTLKTHMWEHNDIKPFECDVCHKKFSQEQHLKRHMIIHSVNKKFKCDLCDMTFNQSGNFKRHKATHTVKLKSKCPICGTMFRTAAQMREHLEEHNTIKPYQCKFCHRKYTSEAILKGHMWAHAEKRIYCKKCNKRFASRVFLKRHMTVHAQQDKESAYQCEICHKRFLKLGNYKVHVTLHGTSSSSNLQCSICDLSFCNNRYLDKHMKENHPESKTFKCSFCSETFLTTYSQSRHIQSEHEEELKKLYECDTCGKQFPSQDAMTAHLVEHGVENPFKCGRCDKAFRNKIRLQLHARVHRGVFNCRFCKMVFHTMKEKRDHVKAMSDDAHKPFQCKICGKTFHMKQRLQRHTRIHTGERPFVCKYCGRSFNQRSHLKDHIRLHTGERPFSCKMCNRAFSHARTLKCHQAVCQGMDNESPGPTNNKPHKAFQCHICEKRFRFEKNWKLHLKRNLCACPCGCKGDVKKHIVPEQTEEDQQDSKARLLLHNIEMAGGDQMLKDTDTRESEKEEMAEVDLEETMQAIEQRERLESDMPSKPAPAVPSVNMENTFRLVETILEAAAGRSSVLKPDQSVTTSTHTTTGAPGQVEKKRTAVDAAEGSQIGSMVTVIKTEPVDPDDVFETSGQPTIAGTDSFQTSLTDKSSQTSTVSKTGAPLAAESTQGYHIVYLGPESIQSKPGVTPASSKNSSSVPKVLESARVDSHPVPEQIEVTSSVAQLIEAATMSEGVCMPQVQTVKQEVGVPSVSAEGTDIVSGSMSLLQGYQVHGVNEQTMSIISGQDYITADPQLEGVTVLTDSSSGLPETLVLDSVPDDAVRIIATRPNDDTDTIIIKIEYDETG